MFVCSNSMKLIYELSLCRYMYVWDVILHLGKYSIHRISE
jgi:hypothetical protein